LERDPFRDPHPGLSRVDTPPGPLCDRAGVRRVRLHDLRHTCVTLLLQLGVPPRVVMEIVGHSTLDMTMRVYGHVSLDAQRTALGQLGTLLDGNED
jgi:integrase